MQLLFQGKKTSPSNVTRLTVSKPVVRQATHSDSAALAKLFQKEAEFHRDLAGYFELRPGFDWTSYIQSKLAQNNRRIFIAHQSDQLAGYISASIVKHSTSTSQKSRLRRLVRRPSPLTSPLATLRFGVIEACFVVETYRRLGAGALLYQHAQQWFTAEGIQRVELGVLANNPAAKDFWEKLGFKTFRVLLQKKIESVP